VTEDGHNGRDLAQWLVEAGRRARHKTGAERAGGNTEQRILAAPAPGRGGSARRVVLASLLAVSFLQYYYFTVAVEIASLPALVVFVPT